MPMSVDSGESCGHDSKRAEREAAGRADRCNMTHACIRSLVQRADRSEEEGARARVQ